MSRAIVGLRFALWVLLLVFGFLLGKLLWSGSWVILGISLLVAAVGLAVAVAVWGVRYELTHAKGRHRASPADKSKDEKEAAQTDWEIRYLSYLASLRRAVDPKMTMQATLQGLRRRREALIDAKRAKQRHDRRRARRNVRRQGRQDGGARAGQ